MNQIHGFGLGALLLAGCGADAATTRESEPLENEDWQLVERSYPFAGDYGEDVCAEHPRILCA